MPDSLMYVPSRKACLELGGGSSKYASGMDR